MTFRVCRPPYTFFDRVSSVNGGTKVYISLSSLADGFPKYIGFPSQPVWDSRVQRTGDGGDLSETDSDRNRVENSTGPWSEKVRVRRTGGTYPSPVFHLSFTVVRKGTHGSRYERGTDEEVAPERIVERGEARESNPGVKWKRDTYQGPSST